MILSKRSRDSTSESSIDDSDRDGDPGNHGDHRKPKKKVKKKHSHKKKHHKSEKHDKSRTNTSDSSKPATIWIEETQFAPKDAHRIDKRSDTSNFSYDSLYTGDIANYQRRFGNYCLGLGSNSLKFTDQRNQVSKKKKINLKQSRYYEDKLCDTSSTLLILRTKDGEEECSRIESKEFLVIEARPMVDEDNSEEPKLSPESFLMKQAALYNTQLLDNPHDIQLWEEFIKFQDEALVWGKLPMSQQDDDGKVSGSLRQQKLALNERKIAIYERALEKNPLSEELLVGHLRLVQEVWDTERLVKQWKDIVFKQPNRSLLWLKYIEFCQSRFSFYRSSSQIALYQKAISTLSLILDRSLLSHRPEQGAESKLLVVFILYCYYLKHSGFVEKAIALFQALIEFNLSTPDDLFACEKVKDRRDIFEMFWDEGVARIGEEGALGWKKWWEIQSSHKMTDSGTLDAVDLKEYEYLMKENEQEEHSDVVSDGDSAMDAVKDLPCNVAWAKLEMSRDLSFCLPGKLASDEGDNGSDLDHTVVFDDITECLFILQDPDLKATLVTEFLRFLGVSIKTVPHVINTFPNLVQMIVSPLEVMSPMEDDPVLHNSKVPNIFYQPYPITCDITSVCDAPLYNLLCPDSNSTHISFPLKGFVTRLFNHSLSLLRTLNVSSDIKSKLICSWLQYELKYILSKSVSSLETKPAAENLHTLAVSLLQSITLCDYGFLWNLITELEPLLGLKKKSISLSKRFLSPFTTSPIPRGSPLYVLCFLFVECMLKLIQPMNCYSKHEPSHSLALFTLVSLSSGEFNPTMLPVSGFRVSQAQVIAAGTYFNDLTLHVLSSSDLAVTETVARLGCCFYFKYLVNGLEPSCQLMGQLIDSVMDHKGKVSNTIGCIVESLYGIEAKLVQLHSLSNPVKPQILRDILCSALDKFPYHSWFLSAFITSEERSFITGQLRRYFNSLTQKSTNAVVPCLFAVRAEISRHHRLNKLVGEYLEEPTSGIVQRTRSFFVRGSQSSIGQLCPVLWRLYIKFEVS